MRGFVSHSPTYQKTPTYFVQPCPVCGRTLHVPVELLGRTAACGHCRGSFTAHDRTASRGPRSDSGWYRPFSHENAEPDDCGTLDERLKRVFDEIDGNRAAKLVDV